jgi:DNA-3-methyladenine glycosylase I
MTSYCDSAPGHPVHGPYHDREYGFPIDDDASLFERMTLEIFQAGLSWLIILKKREAFRLAFENYNIDRVAAFDAGDIDRLMNDPSIIRNRRKIEAVVQNAKVVQDLRKAYGGFGRWIEAHHPQSRVEWCKLFRATFSFMGKDVVGEFMMSIGYLPGAHTDQCPIYRRIAEKEPAWLRAVTRTGAAR